MSEEKWKPEIGEKFRLFHFAINNSTNSYLVPGTDNMFSQPVAPTSAVYTATIESWEPLKVLVYEGDEVRELPETSLSQSEMRPL